MPFHDRAYAIVTRERILLGLLVMAFAIEAYALFFPAKTFLAGYLLGIPDPFSPRPALKPVYLLTLFAATAGILAAGIHRLPAVMKRTYAAAAAVFLLGVVLHVALIGSLRDGFGAFYKRALDAGHGEFLVEAASIDDVIATVRNYEAYVRDNPDRIFMANKGPGVIVFFCGLKRVANSVRPALRPIAPDTELLRSSLAKRRATLTGEQVDDLRYMLAMMFVVFPVLTYLPVFLIFWLGKTYGDARLGVLAAALYLFVPATALQVAHLDFALFPLLVVAILAAFAYGVARSRQGYIVVAALVFALYFVMTLAAVSVAAALVAFLAIAAAERLRRGDSLRTVSLDTGRTGAVFAFVVLVSLVASYLLFRFDPIERYTHARAIQRTWSGDEYNMFWVNSNLLSYALSFGIIYAVCIAIQQWRSMRRVFDGSSDVIDHLTLSWLCLLIGLVAFGRQHSETNRLWAFLNPIGCLIGARLLYDRVDAKRLWAPVFLVLASLLLARYRLNYF
ncbi:MAG TPA: hypothetical protein VFT29_00395 [Gemmatimonadaceae bacterium]|nr:hypothetical protein [Gemmatimonadaceae bacterium]